MKMLMKLFLLSSFICLAGSVYSLDLIHEEEKEWVFADDLDDFMFYNWSKLSKIKVSERGQVAKEEYHKYLGKLERERGFAESQNRATAKPKSREVRKGLEKVSEYLQKMQAQFEAQIAAMENCDDQPE